MVERSLGKIFEHPEACSEPRQDFAGFVQGDAGA
jgi:hypothetical protein